MECRNNGRMKGQGFTRLLRNQDIKKDPELYKWYWSDRFWRDASEEKINPLKIKKVFQIEEYA